MQHNEKKYGDRPLASFHSFAVLDLVGDSLLLLLLLLLHLPRSDRGKRVRLGPWAEIKTLRHQNIRFKYFFTDVVESILHGIEIIMQPKFENLVD